MNKKKKAGAKPAGNGVKKGGSLKLILIALGIIPALVVMLFSFTASESSLTEGMNNEALDGLEMLAHSVAAAYDLYPGDYEVNKAGDLFKGETNLTEEHSEQIDAFTEGYDADVTICFGKTRMLTSLRDKNGERMIGTTISEEVWQTLRKNEIYRTSDIIINEKDYYAVYIPLKDSAGEVIGCVFAGEPVEEVQALIQKEIAQMLAVNVIIIVIMAVGAFLLASWIAKKIVQLEKNVEALSEGNLSIVVDEKIKKRNDEIGRMGRAVEKLVAKLKEVVGDLLESSDTLFKSGNSLDEMASQSSSTADEISRAVEDISRGAVSQADEIDSASREVATMGEVIEHIVGNVGNLTKASGQMSEAGEASLRTMHELTEANEHTVAAIGKIAEQIRRTNESVEQISSSASLITNIAEQTSLLSLNASIESARAGEAGRGFAVVAGEIQKLAEQSDETATEIMRIIDALQEESKETIEVMNQAEGLIREQQKKLDDTKKRFNDVNDGIGASIGETNIIHDNATACDHARNTVVDVITNLSAISEQNAASSQETTASMEELNATINMLAEAAGNLKSLSQKLNDDMKFFKM